MGVQLNSYNNQTHAEQFMEKGYKLTENRQAVLDVLIKNKGNHLSTEEIFKLVKNTHPHIGLATIYRTLPLLQEMGLLSKIDLDDKCLRYEYCDSEEKPHYHLICLQCGSVSEIQADLVSEFVGGIYTNSGFVVKNYLVKIYGYCRKCKEAETQKSKQ